MPTTSVNLNGIIPNNYVRRGLYALYVLVGLYFGAVSVWYQSLGAVAPDWVTGGLQVLGYLAIPFGTLAIANVSTSSVEEDIQLSQAANSPK